MREWNEPRRDEALASAPEVPRHRSRKDRKRWCRGKVGVEHVPETVLRARRYVWSDGGPACFRPEWNPERWHCWHRIRCASCGRTLRDGVGRECPDWSPEITRRRVVRR